MDGFLSVGFGNYINLNSVTAVVHADSAPMKRMIQLAKDHSRAVDATQGRKTKTVIVMADGNIVLSALLPDTIVNRAHGMQGILVAGEEHEEYAKEETL